MKRVVTLISGFVCACLIYLLGIPLDLFGQEIRVPARPAGQQSSVTVSLETFEVTAGSEEDNLFDPGDEPYIWVLYFKVDASTINPPTLATTYSPHRIIRDHRTGKTTRIGSHGNLGRKDVRSRARFPVPKELGWYSATMELLPAEPSRGIQLTEAARKANTMVGVLVAALEEDELSESAVEQGRLEFTKAVAEELNAAILQSAITGQKPGEAEFSEISQRIEQRVKQRIEQAVGDRFWENLGVVLDEKVLGGGLGAADDFIGFDMAMASYAQLESTERIPFILEFEQRKGTELKAGYRIFGSFTSTFYKPPPAGSADSFLS